MYSYDIKLDVDVDSSDLTQESTTLLQSVHTQTKVPSVYGITPNMTRGTLTQILVPSTH